MLSKLAVALFNIRQLDLSNNQSECESDGESDWEIARK
jgi:hypothetical protein